MTIYYVYQYVRDDGTPYYIGKGKGKRAWHPHVRNHSNFTPKDKSKIQIISRSLTEDAAYDLEKQLIDEYKTKENGGILINIHPGGKLYDMTESTKEKISRALKDKPKSKAHIEKCAQATRNRPNPNTSKGLREWYKTNPDRSKAIAKQSESLKGWYQDNKHAAREKAQNTWKTRYEQDLDAYEDAIKLLQTRSITDAAKESKFCRDTLSKLKSGDHGVYTHFPHLANINGQPPRS